eukprot:jgi/Chrzof1/7143/Cz02g12200.t1
MEADIAADADCTVQVVPPIQAAAPQVLNTKRQRGADDEAGDQQAAVKKPRQVATSAATAAEQVTCSTSLSSNPLATRQQTHTHSPSTNVFRSRDALDAAADPAGSHRPTTRSRGSPGPRKVYSLQTMYKA